MKKFIYILPCLALSLILYFSNSQFVSASGLDDVYSGSTRYYDFTYNSADFIPLKIHISDSYGYIFIYRNNGSDSKVTYKMSTYSPTQTLKDKRYIVAPSGKLLFYMFNGGHNSDLNFVNSWGFEIPNVSELTSPQNIVDIAESILNGTYVADDDLGGINNPKPNSSIGFLTNVQNRSGWNNKVYNTVALGNSVTLPYDTEFTFGWDSTTSTGASLTNYKVKVQYAFTYLKSNTETGVLNYVEVVDFNNNYSFNRKWSELLNENGYSVPTSQPADNYNGALASSYPWSYCKVFVQPILMDSEGLYNIGGYTSVVLDKNAGEGFIKTENQDFSTDGFKPSEDQTGTGVNSNPITNTNTSTGVTTGAGELPNVDFSNLKETLNDLSQMVSGVPLIIATMFSFLPNWLILLIVASIGLMVAVGLFKALLNIIS